MDHATGVGVAPGSESGGRLERPAAWPALATLASVVLLWLAAPRLVPLVVGSPDEATFAALEALFAGLAFAGVVWTVLLQSRELALQRAELIATRDEMQLARAESARTASAQEDTAKLAALVALLAREEARMGRFHKEAFHQFSDSNSPSGVTVQIRDARAAADYKEALTAHFRYLDDLKATYERIAGRAPGVPPNDADQEPT